MEEEQASSEQGLTLGQLVIEVERAARGNLALGTQLARITERLRQDTQTPTEVRALAQVLRTILAGERAPDLSELPLPFAEVVEGMLVDLLEVEKKRDLSPDQTSEEDGLTLDELLGLVEKAACGDQRLGKQLFPLLEQLERDVTLQPGVRALAKALVSILAGERTPDLSDLSDGGAYAVRSMVKRLEK
jgi:hypothetical protein